MKLNLRKILSITLPALTLLLSAALVLSAQAQGALPPDRPDRPAAPEAADAISSYIPVQGLLTDNGGNPLDGSYSVTFSLYDVASGGTALCSDTKTVTVSDGLFSTYMAASDCANKIDGRQLYLGIQVGTDAEMTPRSYIDNVPYAWSLRPGAEIESNSASSLLTIINAGTGSGLWATSVNGEGVHGASGDDSGVAGYSLLGTGVYGDSLSGAAIAAGGTGIITSVAESTIWVSGNDIRPYNQDDLTVIDMDTIGGAYVTRGSGSGVRYVMLPITIPSVLYGQNITITDLDIYWVGETEFDGITDIRVRRQSGGVCPTCYLSLYYDGSDHVCDLANNATGCVINIDLTTNNEFSATSGVLYLGLGLNFSGDSTYVEIGGVRLTLTHDN